MMQSNFSKAVDGEHATRRPFRVTPNSHKGVVENEGMRWSSCLVQVINSPVPGKQVICSWKVPDDMKELPDHELITAFLMGFNVAKDGTPRLK